MESIAYFDKLTKDIGEGKYTDIGEYYYKTAVALYNKAIALFDSERYREAANISMSLLDILGMLAMREKIKITRMSHLIL